MHLRFSGFPQGVGLGRLKDEPQEVDFDLAQ